MSDYRDAVHVIQEWEGGKSDSQADNAKNYPSPCGNGSRGYPIHTNKGVTWRTFVARATEVGYDPTCYNFLNMPQWIWLGIYKTYWDQVDGDDIKNQAIANTFAEWVWLGGGFPQVKKFFLQEYGKKFDDIEQVVDYVNALNRVGKTRELYEKLIDFRSEYFRNLNQPLNLGGWMTRLNKFYIYNLKYVLSPAQKRILIYGTGLAIIGTALLIYGIRKK